MSYITDESRCGSFLPKGETPPKAWLHEKNCKYEAIPFDMFNKATGLHSIASLGEIDFKDEAKIAIVPPFVELTIWDNRDYDAGSKWPAKTFKGPGIFSFENTPYDMKANSAKARRTKPWSDAMMPCCTGKIQGKWCGAWNPNDPNTVCDARMKVYCSQAANKDKQECACINSTIKYLPSCFDNKCHTNPLAYKTKDMKTVSKSCPDIMECNQYLNLSDESKLNVINRTKLEQTCVSQKEEDKDITIIDNGNNSSSGEGDGGSDYTGDQTGSNGSSDPNNTYDPKPDPNGQSGDGYNNTGGYNPYNPTDPYNTGDPYSSGYGNSGSGSSTYPGSSDPNYLSDEKTSGLNIGGYNISYTVLIVIFVVIVGFAMLMLRPRQQYGYPQYAQYGPPPQPIYNPNINYQ